MKKERNEPLFYDTNEKGVQQYREDVEKEKEENMVFVENVKELAMLRNRIMEKYNDVLNTYNSFKFNLNKVNGIVYNKFDQSNGVNSNNNVND
jgi:hypothetical protein